MRASILEHYVLSRWCLVTLEYHDAMNAHVNTNTSSNNSLAMRSDNIGIRATMHLLVEYRVYIRTQHDIPSTTVWI